MIVGTGSNDGFPVVTDIVNSRVPTPSQILHVLVRPGVAGETSVVWFSPDGKNTIGPLDLSGRGASALRYATTLRARVAVYPFEHARGEAIIAARIGKSVNATVTFYVRDEAGIGFGCYGFLAQGASVKIVDGLAVRAKLSDADAAVVGPGNQEGTIPGYGCWGENYDPKATSYRLVFRNGGRVLGRHNAFARELPYDAVDETHPLEVIAADRRVYRLHLGPAAGTYFEGWIEEEPL